MGTIRHATLTGELNGAKVSAAQWNENHDIDLAIADVTGLQAALDAKTDDTDLSGYAPLASPALTGTPTAPTAAPGTNTTQLATAAFVQDAAAGKLAAANNLSDLADPATARGNLGANKRLLPLAITGTALTANEVLATFMPPTGETWTFPANLSTSSGKKLSGGTNPAASYAIDLVKNGSSVATITISTGGAVSFATSGGTAFTLTGGSDDLQAVGPAVADTALGYVFTLVCTY